MKRNLIPLALVGLMTMLAAGAAVLAVHDVGRTSYPSSTYLRSTGRVASHHALTQPRETAVTIAHLPSTDLFNRLIVNGGQLQVVGQPNSAVSDLQSSACLAATVNLRSLQVGHVTTESCNDPAIIGQNVEAVVTPVGPGSYLAVSISHSNPMTGQSSVSAPIMVCEYASDTQPVIAYGGGSMWIYDVASSFGAVALQLSASTGALEDTVAMPKLYRPLLAADREGLWVGNSIEGSPSADVIYHVAPGAKTVTGMFRSLTPGEKPSHTLTAQWITASGDHVWAGIGPNLTRESIWRLDGPSGTVLYQVPDSGFDPSGQVVGNFAGGLWTEVPGPSPELRPIGASSGPKYEEILEINPATGAERAVATLPPLPVLQADIGPRPNQMVWLDGSLYLLEPPFEADGYLGYSEVVKVTPR